MCRNGEIATVKAGPSFSLSTYGNKAIDGVAAVSEGNPFFFQFYISKNEMFNEFTLKLVKDIGVINITKRYSDKDYE